VVTLGPSRPPRGGGLAADLRLLEALAEALLSPPPPPSLAAAAAAVAAVAVLLLAAVAGGMGELARLGTASALVGTDDSDIVALMRLCTYALMHLCFVDVSS